MFSFEFFPPADGTGYERLCATATALTEFEPSFFSVTYGAGGTTRDRTIGAVEALSAAVDTPIAGHITCVGGTVAETHGVIDRYAAAGVTHIVALRGDLPADGVAADGYADATSLVAGLRRRADTARFEISVAAYPEVHPLAASGRGRSRQPATQARRRRRPGHHPVLLRHRCVPAVPRHGGGRRNSPPHRARHPPRRQRRRRPPLRRAVRHHGSRLVPAALRRARRRSRRPGRRSPQR